MSKAIIEAAARALCKVTGIPEARWHTFTEEAEGTIAAVTPLIKAAHPEAKRPVAWRVHDYADGWIIFQDEAAANREVEQTGAVMQALYVRDG